MSQTYDKQRDHGIEANDHLPPDHQQQKEEQGNDRQQLQFEQQQDTSARRNRKHLNAYTNWENWDTQNDGRGSKSQDGGDPGANRMPAFAVGSPALSSRLDSWRNRAVEATNAWLTDNGYTGKPLASPRRSDAAGDRRGGAARAGTGYGTAQEHSPQGLTGMQEPARTPYAPGSLGHAISIAVAAHAGQVDKAGAPYILHPLRVMLKQSSDSGRIAAVLHDVVEDSEHWTLDRLRTEGFSEEIVLAIDHLTKRVEEYENYDAFIDRVARNPLASDVKLADLEDNLDITRLGHVNATDLERLNKYTRARNRLLEVISPASANQNVTGR